MYKAKVLLSFLCAAFLTLLPVFSLSVCISVYQTDGTSTIREASRLVENAVMDRYFDSGYIITNEPIATVYNEKTAVSTALSRAKEGGADYAVLISLLYKTNQSEVPITPQISDIDEVFWQIIQTASGKILSSGSRKPMVHTKYEGNFVAGIRYFASSLADETITVIQKATAKR